MYVSFALVALLIILQIVDGWTSIRVLKCGGRERNPFVQKVMDVTSAVFGIVFIKLVCIGLAFYIGYDIYTIGISHHALLLLGAMNLAYVLVVYNNFSIVKDGEKLKSVG